MEVIAEGMKLLQYDYLGGNGSRGYGKVTFSNVLAETVIGDVPDEMLKQCNQILQEGING